MQQLRGDQEGRLRFLQRVRVGGGVRVERQVDLFPDGRIPQGSEVSRKLCRQPLYRYFRARRRHIRFRGISQGSGGHERLVFAPPILASGVRYGGRRAGASEIERGMDGFGRWIAVPKTSQSPDG